MTTPVTLTVYKNTNEGLIKQKSFLRTIGRVLVGILCLSIFPLMYLIGSLLS